MKSRATRFSKVFSKICVSPSKAVTEAEVSHSVAVQPMREIETVLTDQFSRLAMQVQVETPVIDSGSSVAMVQISLRISCVALPPGCLDGRTFVAQVLS